MIGGLAGANQYTICLISVLITLDDEVTHHVSGSTLHALGPLSPAIPNQGNKYCKTDPKFFLSSCFKCFGRRNGSHTHLQAQVFSKKKKKSPTHKCTVLQSM